MIHLASRAARQAIELELDDPGVDRPLEAFEQPPCRAFERAISAEDRDLLPARAARAGGAARKPVPRFGSRLPAVLRVLFARARGGRTPSDT
jgi:hypothetical protein